jgi:hypothetical protein
MMWWQFSQPNLTAVWTNRPSFFSGWQVKHVSVLISFASMKGCSIGSSAQTPKDDRRHKSKGVAPHVVADCLAEANGRATRVKSLLLRIA